MPSARTPNEHVRRSGATYSPCGLYRYRLWRDWGAGETLLWVMLNPSTADHLGNNDATIERCERRSARWGFGRVEIVNLFALRTTDPRGLLGVVDPIGGDNDRSIVEAVRDADRILCAWGSHGRLGGRATAVLGLLRGYPLSCLAVNRSGEPAHPLYLPYSLTPIPYPPPASRPHEAASIPARADRKPRR